MNYFRNLFFEIDVLLNVLTGGNRNETVSIRIAKAAAAGGFKARLLCWLLSVLVERNHCTKALSSQPTKPLAAIRAALTFAGVFYGLYAILQWLL